MKVAEEIRQAVLEAARACLPAGRRLDLSDVELEHPAAEEHGDYSTNIAFKLENPPEVAKKIADKIQDTRYKVQVVGGFINFTLSPEWLVSSLSEIDGEYGRSSIGVGKTVVIDYSAPNIAKRFGIGHLRSTIIGQALYNLYGFLGYKVIGDNHLGDWGTQFGKLLYMIDKNGKKNFDLDDLEKWYVEFHELAKDDPSLEDQGREWFKKLEQGDSVARELWDKCVEISMAEFNRIYDLLGVKIDFAYGESFYETLMPEVIARAKNKGIAKESDGAWVIEIAGLKAPLLLVKSDGTTTYATRDLATLKFRQKEWDPDLVIYEVGAEQALHFMQVFAVARMLGYVKEGAELIHTKHGLYRWEHGKMRTRKGDAIKLGKILDEAISRAKKLGSEDENIAKAVGIGAVKYFDLKHNVQSDIVFDWEKMFSLVGDSGPYLQYTYARAQSVLRKSQDARDKIQRNSNYQFTNEETAILRYLYRFPEVVQLAARAYSPNLVCTYLFELAKRFNNFYNEVPVLKSEAVVFRLKLVEATAQVLKNGLSLLGIEALERM